jgi:hypothetical protein
MKNNTAQPQLFVLFWLFALVFLGAAPTFAAGNVYSPQAERDALDAVIRESTANDYAFASTAPSASEVFGNSDEYLFWGGMAAAAVALGTGVAGIVQHMKYGDASTLYNEGNSKINALKDEIAEVCEEGKGSRSACREESFAAAKADKTLGKAIEANQTNKNAMESYNIERILWWSAAAISAAASITLFTW